MSGTRPTTVDYSHPLAKDADRDERNYQNDPEAQLPIHNIDRYIETLRKEMLGKAFDVSSHSGPLWELTAEQTAFVRSKIEHFNVSEVQSFILSHLSQHCEDSNKATFAATVQEADAETLLHLLEIIIFFPYELENISRALNTIKKEIPKKGQYKDERDLMKTAVHTLRAQLAGTAIGIIPPRKDKTGRLKKVEIGF